MVERFVPATEQEALLALLSLSGVGAGLATRLKRALGSARAVFSASSEQLLSIRGIGKQLVERIQYGPDRAALSRELATLQKEGFETLLLDEAGFPAPMQRLATPPALLYLHGARPWEHRPCIGIVGTRSPDERGLQLTREVTRQLVEAGYVIVSGGAAGIDTCTHRTALEMGGPTVAVLGSGFHRPYPSENRRLFAEISEREGALVTEFAPDVKPERGHFPRRNRLICGLCEGIVVIQCGRQSGALNTATQARRLGIPVFAFPGPPHDPLAAGPHQLIRDGASLVESGHEIAAILEQRPVEPQQMSLFVSPPPVLPEPAPAPTPEPPELTPEHKKVWDVLEKTPLHVDEVAARSELSIQECVTLLLELELDGLVQVHDGFCYSR